MLTHYLVKNSFEIEWKKSASLSKGIFQENVYVTPSGDVGSFQKDKASFRGIHKLRERFIEMPRE